MDCKAVIAGWDGRILLWDSKLEAAPAALKEGLRVVWKVLNAESGVGIAVLQQNRSTVIERWTGE